MRFPRKEKKRLKKKYRIPRKKKKRKQESGIIRLLKVIGGGKVAPIEWLFPTECIDGNDKPPIEFYKTKSMNNIEKNG